MFAGLKALGPGTVHGIDPANGVVEALAGLETKVAPQAGHSTIADRPAATLLHR
jgi:hypothetical protein